MRHDVEKFLDWPFLSFVLLLTFCKIFYVEIKSLLKKGDISVSWGDKKVSLRDLNDNINQELGPIQDQIESLKSDLSTLESKLINQKNYFGKKYSDETISDNEPAKQDSDLKDDDSLTKDAQSSNFSNKLNNDMKNLKEKIYAALKSSPFEWRSIERLSIVTGYSQEQILPLLLNDPNIKLSLGKSGRQIAKLININNKY